MLILILICLILCFIGYVLNNQITFYEFVGTCLISILVSLIVYGLCIIPSVNDTYFQSGKLIQIQHHPYFVEEYEQRHETTYQCGTDSNGHPRYCTRVWYTTEYARHREYWLAVDSLNQSLEISEKFYNQIKNDFGAKLKSKNDGRYYRCNYGGYRISGDNSLYYYDNETKTYNYPTTKISQWYNPIKRTKSIFNTEKEVLPYPTRSNWFSNNRDMTNHFKKQWDILNTIVYERIGANVILTTSTEDLKNYWMRGKKNDIIIQVDSIENPHSVKVFGWYESERLSTELETYILDKGINIDGIQHKILSYYIPFNFKKFDYLKYQLADWQYILVCVVTIIVLIGSYVYFSMNEFKRDIN